MTNEMQMYLMKEVSDIKVKMGKVETLVIEYGKGLEQERERFSAITDLLLELKEDVGKVQGRTEKGDVSLNLNAENVDSIDASTNQNIDGKKD